LTSILAYSGVEQRTSNVSPIDSFIQALYRLNIGIQPTAADLAFWETKLNTLGRLAMVFCIQDTDAGLLAVVGNLYVQLLGVAPSLQDAIYWGNRLVV